MSDQAASKRARRRVALTIGCTAIALIVGAFAIFIANQNNAKDDLSEADGAHSVDVPTEYFMYWDTVQLVSSNIDSPLSHLEDVSRGIQLRSLWGMIQAQREDGQVSVGEVKQNVLQAESTGQRFLVVDCLDLSEWLVADSETGLIISDQPVNPPGQAYGFTLAREDDRWYVTSAELLGSCDGGE